MRGKDTEPARTPIPPRLRALDRQLNQHMENKIVDALVPWTDEGNVKAWETTEHLLWAKRKPVTEHNVFEHIKHFAEKAEMKRRK